jgi:hypothetical protein
MQAGRRLGIAAAAVAVCLAAGLAQAQTRIEPEPSPALGCLQVPDGEPMEPVYPFDQYKGGVPGRVKASVALPGGLFGNEVEILSSEGDTAFVDSSRRFLRSLSAPCLKSGEKVKLLYEFVFQPDQRSVTWAVPQDEGAAARKEMAKCMRHLDGEKSQYPEQARRTNQQGRVLVTLTFASPDGAPEVELMHRRSAEVFASSIRNWAKGMRLPCHTGAEPLRMSVLMIYRMEGEGAFGFKPLTLTELLSVSKGIEERRLKLDSTNMGCPFQLKVTYHQPFRRNLVGEVGDSDPRRRPLLELLTGIELDLGVRALDSVFADTADVTVPCLRLNLNPKEKTS